MAEAAAAAAGGGFMKALPGIINGIGSNINSGKDRSSREYMQQQGFAQQEKMAKVLQELAFDSMQQKTDYMQGKLKEAGLPSALALGTPGLRRQYVPGGGRVTQFNAQQQPFIGSTDQVMSNNYDIPGVLNL